MTFKGIQAIKDMQRETLAMFESAAARSLLLAPLRAGPSASGSATPFSRRYDPLLPRRRG